MITVGLSKHEIDRITKILIEHQVEHHVDAAGGNAEEVKVRSGRGDTSFYQIEIPEQEFKKLPAQAVTKLAELGIYPEMETSDFESIPDKVKTPVDATRVQNNMKMFEKIFLVLLAVMALAFIRRVMTTN